jgi:molecular chaperone GrpE
MSDEKRDRKVEVKMSDKRKIGAGAPEGHDVPMIVDPNGVPAVGRAEPGEHDYLEDLRRLQAEFENYRKRMMKEQTAMAERATIRLVEKLLPVLDSFEHAAAHSEDAGGMTLLGKQLKGVLASEGLEEIPALGEPFDPTIHEAVDSIEDPDIDEPVCREVFRPGYRLKGRIIRPAMVVVARPPEAQAPDEQDVAEG